jgi:AraC-like DNA-binding protein/mannose-6-phosphate isomerase-like protein (cupin superfamily)
MTDKALGVNYFGDSHFPLSVRKVDRSQKISHEDDLTEIEHFHDFTEIVFIIKGKGIQIIEEKEYQVSAGDVFVLQGNQKHYFKDAGAVEIVNVMYISKKGNPLISDEVKKLEGYKALFILESQYRALHYFKNKLHLVRSDMAKLEIILNSMIAEQQNKYEGHELILKNRLEELIVLLSRYYSRLDATEAQSLIRIGKIIDFMEHHFVDKIYLDELSEKAFMSTRNFQRIFKKAVGSSPTNYLMQIRLQNARKLLRESDMPISNIAVHSGFGDDNYFIKCFKKEYTVTPIKFRMKYGNRKV